MRFRRVNNNVGQNPAPSAIKEVSKPILADDTCSDSTMIARVSKVMVEATGLLRGPQRALPLVQKLVEHSFRTAFHSRNLYSYAMTRRNSSVVLNRTLAWILAAQRSDGGIAAYYSLLTGYSNSYPEVTGYIIPTLYDFARIASGNNAIAAAERAMQWLLSLQTSEGAFAGGLHGSESHVSVFNTGQILQGLVRAYRETNEPRALRAAIAAGGWLVEMQQADGSWSGPGAYQETAHTYYSMVSWALAELSAHTADRRYAQAASKNLDWVLSHFRPQGWIDAINLRGHPIYLHFIAYVLQGVLECAILQNRNDAIDAVAKSAWLLLRTFETDKFLPGAYDSDFKNGWNFTCLTGNAQISCVWLRLFETTRDLRYLNAALKINEMLKDMIPQRGLRGIAGGVSGSYPIWGRYQPMRYISWGCKFMADALLLEQRLRESFKATPLEIFSCAS